MPDIYDLWPVEGAGAGGAAAEDGAAAAEDGAGGGTVGIMLSLSSADAGARELDEFFAGAAELPPACGLEA